MIPKQPGWPDHLVCPQCRTAHGYDVAASGNQWVARCRRCQAFIKNMPQGGPAVLYFGKYAQVPLAEVAAKDRAYLEWLMAQPWVKFKVKEQIQEVLS